MDTPSMMPSSSGMPHSQSENPNCGMPPRSQFASFASGPSSTTISSSAVPVDTLISVLQRLEAKLDASDQQPSASRPPRPDPDPPYGMPWEWQSPSWTSEGISTAPVAVSIPPWPPATSSSSSWPHTEPLRQGFATYSSGGGSRMAGDQHHSSWDPPRNRMGDFQGQRPSWDSMAVRGNPYHHTPDPAAGHQPHHVGFSRRLQGSNPHGSAPQHTVFTSPSSWDPPATRMETRGPSSPYAYDPPFGRIRTSWDLPEPPPPVQYCFVEGW